MKKSLMAAGLILVTSLAMTCWTRADAPRSLSELGVASTQRDDLIASLRDEGQSGLEKAIGFLEQAEQALNEQIAIRCSPAPTSILSTEQRKLFVQAIDQIAGQRYGSYSKLYWYTDWDKAVAAARDAKKPILALKMLGKLTDEFSCANSRFFRSTLYVDPSISAILKDKYVLYWSSVRPVPKISIDFGDGRTLERTITGNSAHYVVDLNGNVIDCMPGLNSPDTFRGWLNDIAIFAKRIDNLPTEAKREEIAQYHRQLVDLRQLEPDKLNTVPQSPVSTIANRPANQLVAVPAMAATSLSVSKTFIEKPLVAAVSPESLTLPSNEKVADRLDKQASRSVSSVRLSDESLRILQLENPPMAQAKTPSPPDSNEIKDSEKSISNERMIAALCKSIYEDEAINHQFRHTLHRWFAENPAVSLYDLNERVYSELFLTPSSDPWLGLVNQDAYTGLMNGGLQSK